MLWLAAGCDASDDQRSHETIRDAVYTSTDQTFIMAVASGRFYIGPYPSNEDYDNISNIMGSEGPLDDKSTTAVRCLSSGHITFAVTRRIRSGERFHCNGVDFHVDGCGVGTSCDSYVISAVCGQFQEGQCSRPATGRPQPTGLMYRYRWSTREGITHIDFDPTSPMGDVSLRQGSGLLGLR